MFSSSDRRDLPPLYPYNPHNLQKLKQRHSSSVKTDVVEGNLQIDANTSGHSRNNVSSHVRKDIGSSSHSESRNNRHFDPRRDSIIPTIVRPVSFSIQHDTLGKRIGKGSYGEVTSAMNQKDGKQVAKKIIAGDSDCNPLICGVNPIVIQEVNPIHHLAHHPNVVQSQEIQYHADQGTANLFMPLAASDFSKLIICWFSRGGNVTTFSPFIKELFEKYQQTPDLKIHHQLSITYQIFCGLHHIHHNNITHLDLKPENILIYPGDGNTLNATITDFGIAEHVKGFAKENMSVTLWWRPPEIQSLNDPTYGSKSDVWSVGVMLLEIFFGINIFRILPSSDELMNQIWRKLEDIEGGIEIRYWYTLQYWIGPDVPEIYIRNFFPLSQKRHPALVKLVNQLQEHHRMYFNHSAMSAIERTNWIRQRLGTYLSKYLVECEQVYGKELYKDIWNLIGLCLSYSPQERISIETALKHPLFTRYQNPTCYCSTEEERKNNKLKQFVTENRKRAVETSALKIITLADFCLQSIYESIANTDPSELRLTSTDLRQEVLIAVQRVLEKRQENRLGPQTNHHVAPIVAACTLIVLKKLWLSYERIHQWIKWITDQHFIKHHNLLKEELQCVKDLNFAV